MRILFIRGKRKEWRKKLREVFYRLPDKTTGQPFSTQNNLYKSMNTDTTEDIIGNATEFVKRNEAHFAQDFHSL
jgi:hypothetical protein